MEEPYLAYMHNNRREELKKVFKINNPGVGLAFVPVLFNSFQL
jgi:hypothetical protein